MTAVISEDYRYRYSLYRRWGDGEGSVGWIMCNPSTADDRVNDQTIHKIIGYTKMWGYDSLQVANLWAYRTAYPEELRRAQQSGIKIRGPKNRAYIRELLDESSLVICAWGKIATRIPGYEQRIAELIIDNEGENLYCLQHNKNGSPSHPLLLSYSLKLKPINLEEILTQKGLRIISQIRETTTRDTIESRPT